MTIGIPAGFHRVFPFQPRTHIAPRLTTGIVPSPSPNLTPDRTCMIFLSPCHKRESLLLTSGMEPFTLTAASIHCRRDSGKSNGVRLLVRLSHAAFDGSEASLWNKSFSLIFSAKLEIYLLLLSRTMSR